ncbi:MAG: sensor histidine kinase [Candidatus Limnocylindria bacterium]
MPQPLAPRTVSLAVAGLLGAAFALSGTAAFLVGYAAARVVPLIADGSAEPGAVLPIRAGIETDGTDAVTEVVAGGPAWTIGLRPGWLIDPSYSDGVQLSGAVAACGPTECVAYNDVAAQFIVAERWRFEIVAAILFVAGLVTWRRRTRLTGLLAMAAIAMSAPSYALLGQVPLFPVLYAVSLIAPATWLRLTSAHRAWSTLLVGTSALVLGWAAIWLAVPALYDAVEIARVLAMVGTIAAGIVVASGRITLVDAPVFRDRTVDAGVTFAIIGWAAAAWWFGVIAGWVAAVMVGIALVAYFAFRRRLRILLARMTFAELGQRATLRALEAERSRVARDLHDVPLQELTAVIHRLDLRPEAASETERLREVAGHLREVSISLRPPVLDDVGLGAALAELADRHAGDGGAPIRIDIKDETGIDPSSRPPTDVELAVFRIVQEALTNAQRHARASTIVVGGVIGPGNLRVTVEDDGRGIDDQAVELAQRAGRLGLASMRERATAVGAILRLSPATTGSGTLVTVDWSAR